MYSHDHCINIIRVAPLMDGSSAFQSLRCVISVHMKACVSLWCHKSSLLHDNNWVMSHLRTQAYSDLYESELIASEMSELESSWDTIS